VDRTLARRVRVSRGAEVVLDVLVSDRGPDPQSAYVRLPGDSAVYAQRGQLGELVRRGLDEWREKTVALVTPDSVGEVELVRGTRRTLLQRRDSVWRMGTAAADSAAVGRLLERYRIVSAAGFPTPHTRQQFRARRAARDVARPRGVVLLALSRPRCWAVPAAAGAEQALVYRFNS
jgi:hypothetical protein